jgi:hypothetical protein
MSNTISFSCPNCDGALVVPVAAAGKKAKCKHCQQVIAIPAGAPAKPVARPVAKPVAKAVAPPPPPPPPPPADDANAPLKFKDDDDDEANPYGVVKEVDIPRCPHCAKELDPPDTKVCLSCGYDMQTRQRHKSKKVYETTGQDIVQHQLPAYIWIVVLIAMIVVGVMFWTNMEDWMTGSFLDKDEPNPATQKPQFYVGPNCFNVFYTVFLMFMLWLGISVIVKKLIIQPKPVEVEKVAGDDDDEDEGDDEDDDEEDEEDEEDEDEDERPKKKKKR